MEPGPIEFKKGATILREGESGREMFVIEAGSVEIFRTTGGVERRIRLLETGDFFGEMALLDEQPRGASARAASDCRLLAVDAPTFDQMLRRYPEVAVRMLRNLCRRLREADADGERVPAAVPDAAPSGDRSGALVTAGGSALPLPRRPEITLGRFDSVTNFRPDIDLGELDTQKLTSRRHAKLLREGGEMFVFEEIGTANGTFVNGVRVKTGVKTKVAPGATLRFGGVDLVYRAD
jgi:CRP-like cAMP-binding protein